ncbi:MAG: farnesyl diphosphate synthase [Candidatus Limiplasma sp.]|nr:farnesyl diphosphate synthase [Candidatus Limiplasma sp.]
MQERYGLYQQAVEEALAGFPLLIEESESPSGASRFLDPSGEPVTQASPTPPAEGEIPQPLRSAMGYSLLLPGKRLRPVLLLAAYALLREDWQEALPFACALEMIHTYSLIHDDLPAMDDDAFRRGKPTNHKVFGENMAILAGDGLLNMAYETMLSAPLWRDRPGRALAAARVIAQRAGVRGMIAGQTLDVKLEGTQPEAGLVSYIHRHKTADLIAAPVMAGLLLAGAEEERLLAGRIYGENLGLAFQMVDDLLDISGDAQAMGKQTGMDAARGKMTWPAVFGAERTRRDAVQAVDRATAALSVFGPSGEFLRILAQETLVRVK